MENRDLPGHRLKERFAREAEAASRLHHRNIVPPRQYGQHDNCHFISMALIDGISLDRLLNNSGTHPESKALVNEFDRLRSDWTRLAQMGAEVAGALSHAHENGMIHRDIKPANLILDHDLKIWVTDFGLAKLADQKTELSKSGELIGTPSYMAPEQLVGFADARSDVYGIGLTLYESITGIRPWAGVGKENRVIPGRVLQIPDVRTLSPDVQKGSLESSTKRAHTIQSLDFSRHESLSSLSMNSLTSEKRIAEAMSATKRSTRFWGNRLVHYASLLCIFACSWLCIQFSSETLPQSTRELTATPASTGVSNKTERPQTNCVRYVDPETGYINVLTKVSSRFDDVEENDDGEMYLDSTDLELTWDGVLQTIGIRFAGVKVPRGATIRHAYLAFVSDETDIIETNLVIHGLDSPNPPSFSPLPFDLTKRATMPESVPWTPGPWTDHDTHESSDCRDIVQRLVDHPEWKSENAMGFVISGSGSRKAYTFDGNIHWAPALRIEYEMVDLEN